MVCLLINVLILLSHLILGLCASKKRVVERSMENPDVGRSVRWESAEREGGVIKLITADMKAISFLSVPYIAAMQEALFMTWSSR